MSNTEIRLEILRRTIEQFEVEMLKRFKFKQFYIESMTKLFDRLPMIDYPNYLAIKKNQKENNIHSKKE